MSSADVMQPAGGRRWLPWVGLLVPFLGLGAFVLADVLRAPTQGATIGSEAPAFVLPDTGGGTTSLATALGWADGGALLYFSMGVGCGGCFAQIPEMDGHLEALGIPLVSIVVDPVDITRVEADRYGAAGPIAIDADRAVSTAYGMIGQAGHGDRPSHSFVLVAADGTIADVRHYAEMFVRAETLLSDLGLDDDGP